MIILRKIIFYSRTKDIIYAIRTYLGKKEIIERMNNKISRHKASIFDNAKKIYSTQNN